MQLLLCVDHIFFVLRQPYTRDNAFPTTQAPEDWSGKDGEEKRREEKYSTVQQAEARGPPRKADTGKLVDRGDRLP